MLNDRREFACQLLAALLALFNIRCETSIRCEVTTDCIQLGKCTPTEQRLCVVGSSEDCKGSELCTKQGHCSELDGACVVGSSEDCQGSADCKKQGHCSELDGACVAANDRDCQGSSDCKKQQNCSAYKGSCQDLAKVVHAECGQWCESEGRCAFWQGECGAVSRRHCAGTFDTTPEPMSPCGSKGLCTAEDGRCVAASDQDCEASAGCKDQGYCRAVYGRCLASGADCTELCREFGKCERRDFVCVATSNKDCLQSTLCTLTGACAADYGGDCVTPRKGVIH